MMGQHLTCQTETIINMWQFIAIQFSSSLEVLGIFHGDVLSLVGGTLCILAVVWLLLVLQQLVTKLNEPVVVVFALVLKRNPRMIFTVYVNKNFTTDITKKYIVVYYSSQANCLNKEFKILLRFAPDKIFLPHGNNSVTYSCLCNLLCTALCLSLLLINWWLSGSGTVVPILCSKNIQIWQACAT